MLKVGIHTYMHIWSLGSEKFKWERNRTRKVKASVVYGKKRRRLEPAKHPRVR